MHIHPTKLKRSLLYTALRNGHDQIVQMKELADYSFYTLSGVYYSLHSLEDRGLITRQKRGPGLYHILVHDSNEDEVRRWNHWIRPDK